VSELGVFESRCAGLAFVVGAHAFGIFEFEYAGLGLVVCARAFNGRLLFDCY
jgi:hypothetical protein